ncbi:glutamate carboxypeptidase [Aspergillus terreus]|uniref:Glutamate carboxypeptidase n=1 Tax=Aspergillus terreus TaxID=33178 RepID=A0A5M3Z7V4_ASPTE|nr:hypothetical protein ATETN484_0009001800 [Aspergillus terreus]GFF17469.1 glutamate carboxypeptidase [Aspergillus terreus]
MNPPPLLLFVYGLLLLPSLECASLTVGQPSQQYLGPVEHDLSHETLKKILLDVPSPARARQWSQFYTNGSHLPGQGLLQAEWTRSKWVEFGIPEINIAPYDAFVPYPNGQRLALLDLNRTIDPVLYEASLVEDTNTPNAQRFIPAFHGFSAKGNVTAQFVYVNYGLEEDFEALVRVGVNLQGKIAIVKSTHGSIQLKRLHRDIFRGQQVANAEKMGLAGLIEYCDPQDDGDITESNGYRPFPEGPARPPSMIQRGDVGRTEFPSDPNDNRAQSTGIPSIPISYAEAIPILRALNGHGPLADDLGEMWHGGGLSYKGVRYNIGPSPKNLVLNFYSNPEYKCGRVHNVIGRIKGSEMEDETIILGNHRDAWGPGAGDGNSGSSALNEVARSLGEALKQGWRPLRTIILASWDGQEASIAGSQAWIRDNFRWLNTTAVAYLNVVVAGAGEKFHAQTSPLLHRAIYNATSQVLSPNQTIPGQTVLDVWGGQASAGSGGDAIAFNQAGISSVDFGFTPGPGDAVFPYHSQFDTVEWMDRFGDPNWTYHITTARTWALMAVVLSESPVLPMNVTDYAVLLHEGANALQRKVPQHENFDLTPLRDAISSFSLAAVSHEDAFPQLSRAVAAGNWTDAELWRDIVVGGINTAKALLQQ